MPSWKKVIISGSNAALNSLTVTNGITGSLFGTASYANFAATASNSQNAQDILIYVKNVTGAQIDKGKVVRISGATGDNALIATASYTDDANSANTLGITYQNIPNDSFGYVITEGTLIGIDTSTPGWAAGQLLYLGATGSIIGTAPVAPLHAVRLGQVLRVQLNNGSMYVRIDNGYELGELHDVVDNTTTSSFGDLLVKSGSVWTNSKQLTGSYGLTGSLQATSFTGSLFGTASFASQALSASFASTASFITGSTNAFIQSGNNFGAQAVLGTNDNQSLALETNGSIRMLISSSGNVGINKTTPNARLDVNGNTTITGSLNVINTTPLINLVNSGSGAAGTAVISVLDNTFGAKAAGAQTFRISTNNTLGQIVGTITYTKASSTATNTAFTYNYFNDTAIFISGSGDVGIRTTTPNATLDVSGSAIISGSFTVIPGTIREFQVRTTGVDIGNLITDAHTVTGSLNVSGSITGSLFGTASVAATSVITTQDTTPVTYNVVFTGGTSGNHSLNVDQTTLTYNPSTTTLTCPNLAGTASFVSSTSNAFIQNGNSFGTTALLGTNDNQSLALETSGSTRMFISSSGNVGIGTITPQRKLDVLSGANNFVSVGIDQIAVGQWAGVHFGYAEGANNLYRKSAIVFERTDLTLNNAQGKVHILNGPQGNANSATLADSKLTIDEAGNVGIGTTNPTYLLDVNSQTARFGQNANGYVIISDDNYGGELGIITDQDEVIATKYSDGTFRYGGNTPGTEPLIVSASNVGIGTTTPSAKLNIRGTDALFNVINTDGFSLIYGETDSNSQKFVVKFGETGNQWDLPHFYMDQDLSYFRNTNLGIGNIAPSYPLDVSASVSGTSIYATGDIVAFSDQSVKENIRPIENVLERIGDSRGVLYDRVDNGEKDNIGFIAQELEVAFPELVVTNPDGTKAVKYQNAVAVLFEAIKEQQKQINSILKLLDK